MYQAFLHGLPVLVSLWQAGFYQLFNTQGLKPYIDAWTVVHTPEIKEN